jgi:hypothetical protein
MRQLEVKSVVDIGPQFVDNPHRMVGQDGAYSIPLGDGTAMWYFGDTIIGERPDESLWYLFGEPVGGNDMSGKGPFEDMITNTGLILRDQTGRGGLNDFTYILNEDGTLRQIIESLPGEDRDKLRTWCQHGICIDDKLYLFWMRVLMLEEGGDPFPVGFEVVGSGLAVGSREDWKFERVTYQGDSLLWPATQPQFATGIHHDKASGYVYLYGSLQDADLRHHAHIARVKPDEMLHLDRYQYFAGDPDNWSNDVHDAIAVFSDMPNEMSVSYNEYLGQYLAVHSMGLTGHIVARTSPTPWGPWSDGTVLWSVPPPENPPPYPRLVYAGKEHPELAEESGRILYITYIEFEEYFPHLIEVALG